MNRGLFGDLGVVVGTGGTGDEGDLRRKTVCHSARINTDTVVLLMY